MKQKLHVNPELQLLTIKQMNDIRGGNNGHQADSAEIELPKLPNLPASMPTPLPAYIPEYINQ